jgi:hypothetical protein
MTENRVQREPDGSLSIFPAVNADTPLALRGRLLLLPGEREMFEAQARVRLREPGEWQKEN